MATKSEEPMITTNASTPAELFDKALEQLRQCVITTLNTLQGAGVLPAAHYQLPACVHDVATGLHRLIEQRDLAVAAAPPKNVALVGKLAALEAEVDGLRDRVKVLRRENDTYARAIQRASDALHDV